MAPTFCRNREDIIQECRDFQPPRPPPRFWTAVYNRVVPIKHLLGCVSGYLHDDRFRDPCFSHVGIESAARIDRHEQPLR